jgi:hypothetical protein
VTEEQIVILDMQEDFASKLRTGRPVQAIAELVWNGLDVHVFRAQRHRISLQLRLSGGGKVTSNLK